MANIANNCNKIYMNLNILKEALQALFPDKKSYIIALLLVIIGAFSIIGLINKSEDKIEEEIEVIEEEIQEEKIEDVHFMKDIESNEEQIKALWIYVRRIENEHKDHIKQKRH